MDSGWLLFVVVLAFVAVVLALIAIILAWRSQRTPPPPTEPTPPRTVPDAATPAQLDTLLARGLAGTPADGSAPSIRADARVIWVDHGDEVLVHLDSLRTAIAGETVLVSLDLQTDETGRATLVVPFAVGTRPEGGLTFVTEALPRGPELLVRRWGEAVQNAAYAALLDLARTHADERGTIPSALYVKDGALRFVAKAT